MIHGLARVVLVIAVFGAGPTFLQAEDNEVAISVPSGWTLDVNNPVYGLGTHAMAAAVHNYTGNAIAATLLIANAGGTTRAVEFEGKVFALEYSPGETHLLAQQTGIASVPEDAHRTLLLDHDLRVLWSRDDSRAYSFSTTGETVVAWRPGGISGGGREVEVLSLAGASIASFSVDRPLRGVVAIGDGHDVIVAVEGSILNLVVATPLEIAWRIDLTSNDEAVLLLTPLDPGRILASKVDGSFFVFDVDGQVLSRYEPAALAETDVASGIKDCRGLRVARSHGNTSFLYDYDGDVLTLDLNTGSITADSFDLTPPPGFKKGRVSGNRIVFLSPTEIRSRELTGD